MNGYCREKVLRMETMTITIRYGDGTYGTIEVECENEDSALEMEQQMGYRN